MELKRVEQKDIKDKEPKRLWDHTVLISLDRDNIGKWLEDEAKKCVTVDIISKYRNKNSPEEKKLFIEELTQERYHPKLSESLKKFYSLNNLEPPNAHLQDHAKDGALKRHAPSVLAIILWLTLFLAMFLIEFSFFLYPVISKGAGKGGAIVALILAIGGFMTGTAITARIMDKVYAQYSKVPGDSRRGWLYAGIGLIAVSVGTRTWAAGILGLITTAILGFAVAASEILFEYSLHRRKFCLESIFEVQKYYAAQELSNTLGDYNDPFDDEWYLYFKHEVKKYLEKDAR